MIDGHEQVLLSALMNGTAELPVTTADFSSPPNRTIFKCINGLTNRSFLAVTDALRRHGELQNVGGAHRITEISGLPHDAANVKYALDCILEVSREHRAAEIGAQLHKGNLTLSQAQEQLSQLSEPQLDLPPIEDGSALIAKQIVLPDDVIVGVLHRGGKGVLGGAAKSFKTWLLINLGVSVAAGTPWLGYPTKQGRVLFINLEIQPSFFANRIRVVCDELQVKIKAGYLHVWNLRGHAADLSRLLPQLLRGIGRDHYDLIILDPIYKLLGSRDENKAGDIASLLNQIERLAVLTGAAVIFGAHYSKGNQAGKESIDRVGALACSHATLTRF